MNGIPALAASLLLLAGTAGCKTSDSPTGPYAPPTEGDRQTHRSEQLSREAADLLAEDPEQAEQLLREALSLDLFFGPAHNNLGVLLLERGDLYEAASEFEWARKLMPGHPDPRHNLAVTLERAGQLDGAKEAYRAALEVNPGHIASVQGLTRRQLLDGVAPAEVKPALEMIAIRGESGRWREWAAAELARLVSD